MKQYFAKRLQLLRNLSLILLGFSLAVPRLGLGIACLLVSIIFDVLQHIVQKDSDQSDATK